MHNSWIHASQPHYFSFKFQLIRGGGEKKIRFHIFISVWVCNLWVVRKPNNKKKTPALIAKQGWMRMGYFQNIHAEKGLEIFFHRNNFRKKNEIFRTVSHFIMYPALRVKEYLYLIKRKRHKPETCFNLAIIG